MYSYIQFTQKSSDSPLGPLPFMPKVVSSKSFCVPTSEIVIISATHTLLLEYTSMDAVEDFNPAVYISKGDYWRLLHICNKVQNLMLAKLFAHLMHFMC